MSYAEPAADTESQQILAGIARIEAKQEEFAKALNGLGGNLQWIIDGAQPLLQMLPSMMPMLPGMMGGALGAMPGEEEPHE